MSARLMKGICVSGLLGAKLPPDNTCGRAFLSHYVNWHILCLENNHVPRSVSGYTAKVTAAGSGTFLPRPLNIGRP